MKSFIDITPSGASEKESLIAIIYYSEIKENDPLEGASTRNRIENIVFTEPVKQLDVMQYISLYDGINELKNIGKKVKQHEHGNQ